MAPRNSVGLGYRTPRQHIYYTFIFGRTTVTHHQSLSPKAPITAEPKTYRVRISLFQRTVFVTITMWFGRR